ncbi:hypothetical protein ACFQ07_20835, partial [Actinomadura adrarensis]
MALQAPDGMPVTPDTSRHSPAPTGPGTGRSLTIPTESRVEPCGVEVVRRCGGEVRRRGAWSPKAWV